MMLILATAAAFACTPASAIDGDTLRCGAETIRLQAINARELHGKPCPSNRPCPPKSAQMAKAELARLLALGPVRCTPTSQDRYGRTVARCRVGGADVGCTLTRSGHAAPWPQFGKACR